MSIQTAVPAPCSSRLTAHNTTQKAVLPAISVLPSVRPLSDRRRAWLQGNTSGSLIEGEITDRSDLDLEKLLNLDGVTVTLELANGKVIQAARCLVCGRWQCRNGGSEHPSPFRRSEW